MKPSNFPDQTLQIKDGIFTCRGKSQFFASADYPYFRDGPENWSDRLDKLIRIGQRVITTYIPWRHHDVRDQGGQRYDFTGETLASRNVVGFVELCQQKGLSLVIKPGPFAHAELNYGGLPDFVCPKIDPRIQAMIGSDGTPFVWNGSALTADGEEIEKWPLPAPFDPIFQAESQAWIQAVSNAVLAPYAYPKGPIVLIQVANEGIYSNHQRAVWAYDFSPSSLEKYQVYLQKKYGNLETYNRLHRTRCSTWQEAQPPQAWNKCTQLAEVLTYADWSDYQVDYMGEIYSRLRAQIPAELPCVLNVNPPTDDWFGSDAWLTRINPDRWLDVHYGFTNWIGVACDDRTVVDRYQLMIKRARGSNYEENWGFSKLYEPAFAYDAVSYYQTLIEVASGATGYNIYTGVGTARTSPELDISSRTVYPDVSPIDEHGRVTPKGETVRKLNRFFEHCSDFVETRPRVSVAWGAYLPYSHIRAWAQESEQARLNELGVGDGGRAFMNFEHRLLNQHLDFGLVNLQAAPLSQLQGYRTLGLAAGRWMERATQDKLHAYVEGGGNLLLVGDLPSVDVNLESYDGLQAIQDRIHLLNETEFYQSDDWIELALPGEERTLHALNRAGSDALIWVYEHPVSDVQYLFVFTRSDPGDPVAFEYRTSTGFHLVKVTLPSKSAGVLRVEDGRLSAALIKGENDYTGETIIPACDIDGVTVRAQEPGDWLMI